MLYQESRDDRAFKISRFTPGHAVSVFSLIVDIEMLQTLKTSIAELSE